MGHCLEIQRVADIIGASPLNPIGASPLNPIGASPLNPIGASPLNPIGASPLNPIGASPLNPLFGAQHCYGRKVDAWTIELCADKSREMWGYMRHIELPKNFPGWSHDCGKGVVP